nr:molybdopterin-dependent oxidoreductase [Rhodococcus sp. B50]
MHLRSKAGTDAALFAGMLHVILSEQWHNRQFCDRYGDGLAALSVAVGPATPERTEAISGVPVDQVVRAAGAFAGASGATGMAPLPTSSLGRPESFGFDSWQRIDRYECTEGQRRGRAGRY